MIPDYYTLPSFRGFGRIFCALALNAMLVACSASVLIKKDDPTFTEAQNRLERTTKTIEELQLPPLERNLFLQAESFYLYRFEPPPRGTALYLTEAAAAITDFPAFQSLAGSLDLQDLRYRAPDCAVQLWESLLSQYPKTTLKPLVLYRLGWAYRNAGVKGLPRESPDAAFDELIKDYPTSPLASLAQEAKSVPWKSKSVATTRSIIPGLGQLYVGETRNGVVRLGIAIGSLAAVLMPVYTASHIDRKLTWNKDWPLLATSLVGLIVLSFDYTNSYEDTMRGVVQWNERAESEFYSSHPTAP